MGRRLTDQLVRELPAPAKGNRVYYDRPNKRGNDYTAGLGLRVTAANARSFVLNYRTADGRERRHTIGRYPTWSLLAARDEAKRLKRDIDTGADPVSAKRELRGAPTVADLLTRFEEEHLPTLRPSTQREYRWLIREIVAELGKLKVATCSFDDVSRLHRKVTARGTPYRANRILALLSKAFSLANLWKWRETASPTKGVKKNTEHARERFLTPAELERLSTALDGYSNQSIADAFRLMLLTGARCGEVVTATWDQINFDTNTWVKPYRSTKQKRDHAIPLGQPARQLLARIRKTQTVDGRIFPGVRRVQYQWEQIRAAAGLRGVRIHDLRHNFASVLANSGHGLPVVGRLLGHSSIAVTARYAHLYEETLAKAADTAGAILTGRKKAAVVALRGGRR
jgi:integrase